ncbi:MAG TPA: tRNA (guanosine(46)-N7)-methyltransferase TrmB [Bacteroidales bacterium]
MGKDKLRRFAELHTFQHVIEADYNQVYQKDHAVKGTWHKDIFRNNNPIVLELGCGKGEYVVALAQIYPDKNFIGIDIKGNRMWVGAKQALEKGLTNVYFVRTRIEFIESFFSKDEVDEIWVTFPDPQMQSNRRRKRLTAPSFLNRYKNFLKPQGIIHLKTDSLFLHKYTKAVIEHNQLPLKVATDDLYNSPYSQLTYGVTTHYEKLFIQKTKKITFLQFQLLQQEIIDIDQTYDRQLLSESI